MKRWKSPIIWPEKIVLPGVAKTLLLNCQSTMARNERQDEHLGCGGEKKQYGGRLVGKTWGRSVKGKLRLESGHLHWGGAGRKRLTAAEDWRDDSPPTTQEEKNRKTLQGNGGGTHKTTTREKGRKKRKAQRWYRTFVNWTPLGKECFFQTVKGSAKPGVKFSWP